MTKVNLTDPEGKPVDPEGKPVDPEGKSVSPEGKPVDPEGKPVNPEDKPTNPEGKAQELNPEKLVDKLQKRVGKEHAEKNEFKDKYQKALDQIEALKSGKTIKELAEDDKKTKVKDEKDQRIQELESKLHRRDVASQADGVLKEAGITVKDQVLDMLVNDDNKTTFANVKALVDLINNTREEVRKGFLKGRTPRTTGNPAQAMTKEEIMKIKDPIERQKAIQNNFDEFIKK